MKRLPLHRLGTVLDFWIRQRDELDGDIMRLKSGMSTRQVELDSDGLAVQLETHQELIERNERACASVHNTRQVIHEIAMNLEALRRIDVEAYFEAMAEEIDARRTHATA